MNKAGGFITLHRQILDWEWYKSTNTKVLFLHLLLNANFRDASFEGHKILRGQLVTSLPSLAVELGMSIKQIRGSLDHLISTGEVTSVSYPRYRIITIVKYNDYQDDDRQDGSQTAGERAGKRQSKGSQRAGEGQAEGSQRAAIEQYNNNNNGTREQGNHDSLSRPVFSNKEAFDAFWSAYPKKVAKTNAMKAWLKLLPDEDTVEKIMSGLYVWKHSEEWTRDDGRFIPHPATWLNGRRWEDEVPKITTRKPAAPSLPAQEYHQRDYSDAQEAAFERMMALGGEDL
jgi:hypothetical protein